MLRFWEVVTDPLLLHVGIVRVILYTLRTYLLTGQNKGRDPGHKSHFRFCNVRTNSYEGLYDT